MQYTRLGETELVVSRICFGTWQYSGAWGAVERDDAKAAIRRALDLGINFFDTAQAYGFGDAEAQLADALRPELSGRRDELVIATKGGLRPGDSGFPRDAGRDWLREGLESSLRHLRTDYIDLYQVHWPDPATPAEETAAALTGFLEEGTVRYVGVSNYSARQMMELERYLPVHALQPPYHLFRREIEKHVLPYCQAHGVGTLVYGPLAHGLLGGDYDENTRFDSDDWRSGSSAFTGDIFHNNLEIVDRLKQFAREREITVAQLAIAWVLAHPAVDAAIVGARRPDQIRGTAPAGELFLDDSDLMEIEEISDDRIEIGGATPEGID